MPMALPAHVTERQAQYPPALHAGVERYLRRRYLDKGELRRAQTQRGEVGPGLVDEVVVQQACGGGAEEALLQELPALLQEVLTADAGKCVQSCAVLLQRGTVLKSLLEGGWGGWVV